MSWWVSLNDEDGPVTVEPFAEGGTYVLGGSSEAHLNITYNYGKLFYEALGQRDFSETLHGARAREVTPLLEAAVATLGTERSNDYWKATPGNAGRALSRLLAWAKQYPDATFEVS